MRCRSGKSSFTSRGEWRLSARVSIAPGAALLAALLLVTAAQVTISGTTTQITADPAIQFDPSISGDIVVFTDDRNGNDDVYYIDLADLSETRVTSPLAIKGCTT